MTSTDPCKAAIKTEQIDGVALGTELRKILASVANNANRKDFSAIELHQSANYYNHLFVAAVKSEGESYIVFIESFFSGGKGMGNEVYTNRIGMLKICEDGSLSLKKPSEKIVSGFYSASFSSVEDLVARVTPYFTDGRIQTSDQAELEPYARLICRVIEGKAPLSNEFGARFIDMNDN